MAIDRTYSPGWGIGEKLTSAQMNAVDVNVTNAIDKRSLRYDSFMSVLVPTGQARVLSTVATGPDAQATFTALDGQIIRIPTLTAARTYTLAHTGATGGERLLFYAERTGMSPSGYVDILNAVGTALYRISNSHPNATGTIYGEGSSAEVAYVGSAWQLATANNIGFQVSDYIADGVWVCPPKTYSIQLIGWGGGGGGGCGGGASGFQAGWPIPTTPAIANSWSQSGGGGGGGAQLGMVRAPVLPGQLYGIRIGQGGTCVNTYGGVTAYQGAPCGSDGSDTVFYNLSTLEELARFKGAQGGGGGNYGLPTAILYTTFALGGGPVAINGTGPQSYSVPSGFIRPNDFRAPGQGGGSNTWPCPTLLNFTWGAASINGFAGGAPGAFGTGITGGAPLSGYGALGFSAGGGGGGGGGGPGGPGATGGVGKNFDGVANTAPLNAPANSGAGGGGGGGGGASISSAAANQLGVAGSQGGSGKLTVMVIK